MEGQTRAKMALIWKGKSQKWLAEESGLRPVTLCAILSGRIVPNEREKTAIARALRMPEQRLFMEVSLAEASGFFFGNPQAEELFKQRMRRTSQRREEEEE